MLMPAPFFLLLRGVPEVAGFVIGPVKISLLQVSYNSFDDFIRTPAESSKFSAVDSLHRNVGGYGLVK